MEDSNRKKPDDCFNNLKLELLYEALAKIVERKYGVRVEFEITKKEDAKKLENNCE